MTIEDSLLAEAVTYFKSNKGFRRAFDRMKSKYQSLGVPGGTIELRNLLPEEKEALTGFLRKNYMNQKSASIKVEHFQKALENTKFNGLQLTDILNGYFGEALISNKAARERYLKEQTDFFSNIIDRFENTASGEWLTHLLDAKDNAYHIIVQRYDVDKERLQVDINFVCEGLEHLPVLFGKKLRLPVFASNITSNPHAFDDNTTCGQIFLHALAYQFGVDRPVHAEEKAQLYYAAGIVYDEVSNYVLTNGLKAYSDGVLHPGWEGFYQNRESLQASLANLSAVDKVVSPDKKVYVLENAGVFAAVLDKLASHRPPLICTYGQVKIASLVLLDMLVKEDTTIYYSGDFDPEGLRIADKLKQRYGEKLVLWRYDIRDYKKALSNEKINDIRLKKMDSLHSPELVALSQQICSHGCAGYQEAILDNLISDIQNVHTKGSGV